MSPATGKGLAQQRGIKQRWQAWACPSKEPFEANKEGIHVVFLAGCCGRGEAENRPVKSVGWRAARGGCPAGFHRTSRCYRSPAGALRRSSCGPARPAPHPSTAGTAAPCSALPNQLSPDRENNLGSRTGNWIRTGRRDEKLMFCGNPPQSKCSTSLYHLQAMRSENKRNGKKADTPHFFFFSFLTFVWGE